MRQHAPNPDASPEGFDLLREDGSCLVVAKPGGVLTQAPPGIDSMEVRVRCYLARRESGRRSLYLGVPHRLDRPASGALVLAKSIRAARRLSEQFQGRLVQKKYWALVEGKVEPAEGEWTDYIRKTPGRAFAETADRTASDARRAVLRYRLLMRGSDFSWLEIELETGRTHQIRVQAASRGLPILGDDLYGATLSFGPQTEDVRRRWIALHARSITFRHPKTRRFVSAAAPLPAPWLDRGLDERDAAAACLEGGRWIES